MMRIVGRRMAGCLCMLLCAGPVLIAIGVVMLMYATTDTRGDLIKQYNTAVDEWTSTHRDQFAQNAYQITSVYSTAPLSASTAADALNDKDSKIHTYQPLKYQIPMSTILYPTVIMSIAETLDFTIGNYTFTDTIDVITVDRFNCPSGPTGPAGVSSGTTGGTCDCTAEGGTYDPMTEICTVTTVLTSYCVKIQENDGEWTESSLYSGYGCGEGNNWETATLSDYPSSTGIYTFKGTITLRSANDPYVVAAYLTQGSYNFGLTQAEKVKLGFTFIIVGGVFVLPAVLITVLTYKYCKKQHHHHHYQAGYQPVYQPVYYNN